MEGQGHHLMANLKDVARLAEVDPSTVSRVLRGDPSQAVRPETRERIFGAARTLAYRPNALARGLRTRRTDTIGLVIPNIDNFGFAEVTHGVQAAAARAGKLVLLIEADILGPEASPDATERMEELYLRLVGDGRLDGMIVAFASLDDHLVAQLAERQIPLLLVNRRTIGVSGSVVVDDERGSRMALDHLVGLGHRKIGFLGLAADTDTARRRARGYRAGMAAAGLAVDDRYVATGPPTLAGGRAALETVLGRCERPTHRPTALFAASLLGAIGAHAALKEAGIVLPDEVSLIAFNDHELAAHLDPPLTTVRMPNARMGQEAVAMLLGALEGRPVEDRMIEEPPVVIARGSTAPPMISVEEGT
jgi:LacI family transcriptional regulator